MAEGRWVRITPGFLLTMAVMFWLDEGVGLLGWGVLACVVHELGHLLVGAALGGRPRWLSLSAVGLELNMEYPAGLSYGRELAVALAGPAVNLLLLPLGRQFPLFATLSLCLAVFNLLPVAPLDGGRALRAALLMHLETTAVRRVMTAAAAVCGIGLAILSLWVSVGLGGGLWPVLVAALTLLRVGLSIAEEQRNQL